MLDQIKNLSKKHLSKVKQIRFYLHQNPELSFQEHKTSGFIKEQLNSQNIPFESIAGTGIVATIPGKKKEAICLRAELDALPITEQSNKNYASINKGVMHACGHDVHMASLLGTCFILSELKEKLSSTVKVLFQPGEEKLPGGASIVLQEGIIEKHNITRMVAQHVAPSIEVGKLGFRPGVYMASCDEIFLEIKGKGGHAAMKETYNNPLLITAKFLQLADRLVNTSTQNPCPSVLSFGKINSEGGATNIIPEKVFLEGTFRTFDEGFRAKTWKRLNELALKVGKEFNTELRVEIKKGYPFLNNNSEMVSKAVEAAKEFVGKDNVVNLDLRMTSEDFAYFSQKVPVCFYRLGVRNEAKGIASMVHTPTFDIDEGAFGYSSLYMAYLACIL